MPWKYPRVEIPHGEIEGGVERESFNNLEISTVDGVESESTPIQAVTQKEGNPGGTSLVLSLPWAALAALLIALLAQNSLEPGPGRTWIPGVVFYMMALGCLGFAIYRGEWPLASLHPASTHPGVTLPRSVQLLVGLFLVPVCYISFANDQFSVLNLVLLLSSVTLIVSAFWVRVPSIPFLQGIKGFFQHRTFAVKLSSWTLLVLGAVVLVIFFRFARLDNIPAEMNSDHAEKILDILRLLKGETNVFFPNNGGREPIQMYMVAGLNRLFGLPVDFLALKISSTLVGFASLFFIYLLGKEIATPRVGLIAFIFAGIAYWPNVVSRLGLRLPLYFFFTAATLYFLVRGLQRSHRNDFLLAGITLGLSLYGYTADRSLPLVVIAFVGLYLLHRHSSGNRKETLLSFGALVLIALVLFLPLFHYMLDYPGAFLYRTLSRMGEIEKPLPGSALTIFFSNLGRSLAMVSWSNGEVWTLSIPYRPALDIITGALYWIGLVLVFVRYLRQRHWLDLSLLISIPILMLPAVMALAFPNENPNLYRSGGAVVPVFVLIALALDGLMSSLEERLKARPGKIAAWVMAGFLLLVSVSQNFDLVFNQYDQQYRMSSWNTSEMGEVIRSFAQLSNSPETAWVVGYPYWVDTRLVGMQAGQPDRDLAIKIEQLPETLGDQRPKLFLLKPEDEEALLALNELYPEGWVTEFVSKVPTKEFLIFYAPPRP